MRPVWSEKGLAATAGLTTRGISRPNENERSWTSFASHRCDIHPMLNDARTSVQSGGLLCVLLLLRVYIYGSYLERLSLPRSSPPLPPPTSCFFIIKKGNNVHVCDARMLKTYPPHVPHTRPPFFVSVPGFQGGSQAQKKSMMRELRVVQK